MPRRSTRLTRKSISSFSRFAQAACRSCPIEYVRGGVVSVSSLSPFEDSVYTLVFIFIETSHLRKIGKATFAVLKQKSRILLQVQQL